MFESQRYFLFLPHPFPLLLQRNNLPVFEASFEVFLLDPFLYLLTLSDLRMLVVEHNRSIGFIADQIMLKLILIISRYDLLVDVLRELCLILLPAFEALLQIIVFLLLAADGLILDELQRVL